MISESEWDTSKNKEKHGHPKHGITRFINMSTCVPSEKRRPGRGLDEEPNSAKFPKKYSLPVVLDKCSNWG